MPLQNYSQYPPMPSQPVPSSGLFANQIPGYGMPPPAASMMNPVPPPPAAYGEGITRKAEDEGTEAPGTKKPRYEGPPLSEDEWLAHHPVRLGFLWPHFLCHKHAQKQQSGGNIDHLVHQLQEPISLTIQTPTLSEYKLTGETITIDDLPLTTLVSTLKNRIADKVGMPYGKQKLSVGATGTVMNNSKSLAFYNFQAGSNVILGLKDKGKK